jgi:hypothetical protein
MDPNAEAIPAQGFFTPGPGSIGLFVFASTLSIRSAPGKNTELEKNTHSGFDGAAIVASAFNRANGICTPGNFTPFPGPEIFGCDFFTGDASPGAAAQKRQAETMPISTRIPVRVVPLKNNGPRSKRKISMPTGICGDVPRENEPTLPVVLTEYPDPGSNRKLLFVSS